MVTGMATEINMVMAGKYGYGYGYGRSSRQSKQEEQKEQHNKDSVTERQVKKEDE